MSPAPTRAAAPPISVDDAGPASSGLIEAVETSLVPDKAVGEASPEPGAAEADGIAADGGAAPTMIADQVDLGPGDASAAGEEAPVLPDQVENAGAAPTDIADAEDYGLSEETGAGEEAPPEPGEAVDAGGAPDLEAGPGPDEDV